MTTSIQEMQWVLRAQVGDREALEDLLRALLPSLRRYLAGLAGSADADDLLQNVFIIVIRKIGDLEDPAVFRAWTFRVASREAFRHLRKRRVWMGKHDDDPQLENLPGPEVRPVGELLQQLLAADVVSPASRAVLMLHFQEELSLPETAAILDIPLGTAKSRRAYGLAAIRRHVAGLQSKIRPTNGPEGKTRPTHSGGSHGDHSGETLHRSLNAVDAYRKRMIMALVFLVVLLAVVFFNGADGGGDTLSAFLAHFFILIIWVTALAVIVMMQISVMTKRILRAIKLASRK